MAEGVRKSFKKAVQNEIEQWLFLKNIPVDEKQLIDIINNIDFKLCYYTDTNNKTYPKDLKDGSNQIYIQLEKFGCTLDTATRLYLLACKSVQKETHQAMEAGIHNFNSLHSRAGGQNWPVYTEMCIM